MICSFLVGRKWNVDCICSRMEGSNSRFEVNGTVSLPSSHPPQSAIQATASHSLVDGPPLVLLPFLK